MAKLKHTPDEPRRAAAQAALARRRLETRSLATLQTHLTPDLTRGIVDVPNGNSPGHELPQREPGPPGRKSRRTCPVLGHVLEVPAAQLRPLV